MMLRLALLALLSLVSFSPVLRTDIAGQATVIDGDTIEIHGQRIRLFGIDAHESGQLCEAAGQRYRFVVLPKRWVVERTFAWIARNRRLARDFERYASTVTAFVRIAMIRIMLRRLIRPIPSS